MIMLVITFLQGIYNYIPETNHVSSVYSDAAVLYLQFVLHAMLFRPWNMLRTFYISTFRSKCEVHNMAVFCSSIIACFPGLLLRYCPSDFEMAPIAPVIAGITFAFTFHTRWISFMRSLYFKIFSAYFLITFLFPGIAASINMHVPCLLSRIMMSGLLLRIVLTVRTCWFHNMATLPSDLFRLILVHGHTGAHCLILHLYYYYYYHHHHHHHHRRRRRRRTCNYTP